MREALLKPEPHLINPFPKNRALLSINCHPYWQNFEKMIVRAKNIEIDYEQVLDKVDQLIYEIEDNEYKRDEACKKTENINMEMDFAAIPKGNYKSPFTEDVIEIKEGIEIQTTPITQYQWTKVMGDDPSHFKTGEGSREVEINGKKIEMHSNRPVENVSYEDIKKFIAKLNEQEQGGIYEYHLPSLEEYLAVIGNNPQTRVSSCLNKDETCHIEFSGYTYLGGKRIYSILDNVLEFTRDSLDREDLPSTNKILFGLAYYLKKSTIDILTSIARPIHYMDTSSDEIGFRLIRYKKEAFVEKKTYDLSWSKEDILNDKNYIWDKTFQIYIHKAEHLEWMVEHKDQYPKLTQYTLDLLLRKGSIQKLKDLTELRLGYRGITDLTPLSSLTKLAVIDLDSNEITDLTPLAGLTNLTWLILKSNKITDLTPLADLTNLEVLYLNNNYITDLTPLAGLMNLTWLNLDSNKITNLTPLAGLTNLEQLYLEKNLITDYSPLETLERNGCKIHWVYK